MRKGREMDKSSYLGCGALALITAAVVATYPNVRLFIASTLCVIGAIWFVAATIKAIEEHKDG